MESPPPESPFFINNSFNPTWFEAWSQVLTLQECDARYLKRSGGIISGSLQVLQRMSSTYLESESTDATTITNSTTCDNYGVHLHAILSGATGFKPSTSIAFNNSLNDNVPLANICLDKIGTNQGELSFGTRNGSTCDERLRVTSSGLTVGTGSVTCGNLIASTINGSSILTQTIADTRYVQLSGSTMTGNLLFGTNRIGINTASPSVAIDLGNVAANQKLALFNNGTVFYGFGANNSALKYLSDGSHTWYTSSTPTAQGTQIMNLSSGGTLTLPSVSIIGDTVSGATSSTILRWGDTNDTNCQWYINYFRASSNINNHFSLYNNQSGSAGLIGINIGQFNGLGSADGAMVVLNGIQSDGNFITCGTSATNAALHINAGIPQAVPAGWNYSSTGSGSAGGGTVSVSLYCYNNVWVRGNVYCTSDLRLKNQICEINSEDAMKLLKVTPKWYSWKSDENNTPMLGVIAQELLTHGLHDLVQLFKNEDLDEQPEYNIPKGKQLVVSYDKIPLYLLEIIKNQQTRIDKLENMVNQLIDLLPKTKKASFNIS